MLHRKRLSSSAKYLCGSGQKKQNRIINNKGISLIELIIVIAIMAVLIGVLAPNFSKFIEKSRKSKDIYTASQIAEAVNIAFIEHPEAYEAYQNWGKVAGTGFSLNVSATVDGVTENYTVDLVASNGT